MTFSEKIDFIANFFGGPGEFSKKLSITPQTLRNWKESGPTENALLRIQSATGISRALLLSDALKITDQVLRAANLRVSEGELQSAVEEPQSRYGASRELQLGHEILELKGRVMELESALKDARRELEDAKINEEMFGALIAVLYKMGLTDGLDEERAIRKHNGAVVGMFPRIRIDGASARAEQRKNWQRENDEAKNKASASTVFVAPSSGFTPKIIEGAGKPLAPMPGFEARPDSKAKKNPDSTHDKKGKTK